MYSEFKAFFRTRRVLCHYYDYYQPEAYIPQTDTYIEKDSSINDEIERLRIAASSSLISRRDVIVIASVSCIYGLGSPEDFKEMMLPLSTGMELSRDALLARLVEILYERNDVDFKRGSFRVRHHNGRDRRPVAFLLNRKRQRQPAVIVQEPGGSAPP